MPRCLAKKEPVTEPIVRKIKMNKTILPFLLLLTPALSLGAEESFWTEDVWKNPDRGFLFYGEKKPDEAKDPKEFETVEELKFEAQKRLNVAVMNPTESNIKAYLEINTLMLEKSSQFAQRWKETLWANPGFDHTVVHPNANFAQVALKDKTKLEKEAALTQLAQSSGLVILVQNGCSFCGLMAPVIHRLQEETGFNVLAVTIKGGIPQEWPASKPDNGIVKRLMTLSGSVPTVTPAIFLVDRQGKEAHLIASGALSLEDLKDRLVQASGLSKPMNSTIKTLPRL